MGRLLDYSRYKKSHIYILFFFRVSGLKYVGVMTGENSGELRRMQESVWGLNLRYQ